jgi:membrane protein YqaA with SNARE-associated domain
MLNLLAQAHRIRPRPTLASTLRHLGATGLFFLGVLDSSPLPTFGGPDIVTAILAAGHRPLWYEYAAAATAGSVVGAYMTFRLARKAGSAYLDRKFKKNAVGKFLKFFNQWGTGSLVASTLIPLPTPTSLFFAAAGASNYPQARFLSLVAFCRAVRYFGIAFIAAHYGRRLLQVLRHPTQHWGWLVLLLLLSCVLVAGGIVLNRRVETVPVESELQRQEH